MLNMIGALFVFTSATMIGMYMSSQYMNRPRQIRMLHQMLQRLETEITYGSTPLGDALTSIGNRSGEPVASLCFIAARQMEQAMITTGEAWDLAIEEVWPTSALRGTEKEIMHHLGKTLGSSDRQDQMKHLRLTMNQLQQEEQIALEEQQRYAKMWRSLGMLGGALVVVLMY